MASPQQIAQKWGRRLGQSAEDMRNGADGVDVSPGQLAADNIERYIQGVQEAYSSGKTANRMRAVSLEDWKRRYKEKGIPNATAAANNQNTLRNVENFQAELEPVIRSIKERNRQMKRDGVDGRQRVLAAIDAMEEFGRNRR